MIKIGRGLFNILLISLLFLGTAFAQDVKIDAQVDRDTVEIGDSFLLTLSVESSGSVDINRPDFPKVENFLLLDIGQSSSQEVRFINGKMQSKRTISYNFELQAKKKGSLVIPKLKVVVDGKELSTKDLRINVVDAGTLPNRPQARNRRGRGNSPFGQFPGFDEDPFERLLRNRNRVPRPKADTSVKLNPDEAFQVRVIADKDEVFVGEQITANYYIYVPSKYVLTSFDAVKYPNLQGFWKEDIEMAQTLRYESVVVDGRPYNRALLASYALFPIKEGLVKLDEYKAKCEMAVSGFLGLGKARSYTKSSLPVKVKVKPLPLEGRPLNFTGAVGSFQMSAKLGPEKIKAHQPFTYHLKIEGQGNAKSIELPDLNLPPTLEVFDQKEESKFFKDGRSFKEFTIYFIPRKDGDLSIPEIRMAVFNPESASYEEIKSGEVQIRVNPGEKPQIQPLAQGDQNNGEREKQEQKELHFPFEFEKSSASMFRAHASRFNLAFLILILIYSGIYARAELGLGSKQAKIIETYNKRLSKLKGFNKKGETRNFGIEGSNTIYAVLNLCLDDVETGAELDKVLTKISPKLRSEIEPALKNGLKDFQTMAFAPEEILSSYQDSSKRDQVLKEVDKVLKKLIEKHES